MKGAARHGNETLSLFFPDQSQVMAKAKKQQNRKQSRKQKTIPTKGPTYLPLVLILLGTAFAFSKVFGFDFMSNWDDQSYILRNADIQSFSMENIGKVFSGFYVSNYQPLTMLVFMIEFALFKMDPGAFHGVNLLIHLINVFLVYRLVSRWTNSNFIVWLVAGLFALHPTRVESVAWISELKDVLYTAFFILALDYYTRYIKEGLLKKHYWLALLMFLLSCLSKSMAITLPVVLIVVDYWMGREFKKQVWLEKLPFFALAILFGILAIFTQSGKAMDIAVQVGPVNRIFLAFYGVFMYLSKLVLPINLSGIHYYPVEKDGTLPLIVYASPIILGAIAYLLMRWKSMRKEVLFGIGFFVVSIGIVLQLLPFGRAIIAERYTYVPYIGLFLIIAFLAEQIRSGKLLSSLKGNIEYVAMGVLVVLAVMTYNRTDVWKDSIAFYSDIIEEYPEAAHAHWQLGNVLKDYKRADEAIASYNNTIQLDSGYAMAYFNRGVIMADKKQFREAMADYNKTIELRPDYMPAYHNRGNAKKSLKDIQGSIDDYALALGINPDFVNSLSMQAHSYSVLQQWDSALANYNKLIELNPKNGEAFYNRGLCLINSGQKEKACSDFNQAAQLRFQGAANAIQQYCGQ